MAKKQEASETNTRRIGQVDDEGFIALGRWDIDAWYKAEKGRTIRGIVRDAQVSFDDDNGRAKLTYIVELTRPCICKPVGEDELSEHPAGTMVGLNESAGLRLIRGAVDTQSDVEVRATPNEKKKLDRGRSFWDWTVDVKPGKRRGTPLNLDARLAAEAASGNQDNAADAPSW